VLRFTVLVALALEALVPARADEQPGPDSSFRVVDAKAGSDKLTWSVLEQVPVQKTVPVEVVINGMKVLEVRTITVHEGVVVTRAVELKDVRATDGAGKAINSDKLAELLKEMTPVVLVSGPVAEKHRKLFKDTTLFLELPQPKK
jgi:hypothetical protein